jgi:1-acyl-sn-glycerol-3-phosphate acyltransferase
VDSQGSGAPADSEEASEAPPEATKGSRRRKEPRVAPPITVAWFRDWLFTIPFLLGFGLILLVFDPLQRVARVFGPRPHEIVVGWMQGAIMAALRLCGTRYSVERADNVRPATPYLVVSNHQSMFDIPLIGWLLFTNFPKYVSKKELAHGIPSISYNLRRGGNALINRASRVAAVAAITQLAREQVLARGVSAVIFPEGTRAVTGELGRFRPQGTLALLAAAPDTQVLPVAIDNMWRVSRWGLRPVPFGTRVKVSIGAPLPRDLGEDREMLIARAHEHIQSALQRFRETGG